VRHLECALSIATRCFLIINQVTEHKYPGLENANDGNWQKHIDLITKKAFIRVNILRKFKFIPDRKTLEKIYLTFIRPILEYADVVWDNKTLFLEQLH
jgi:hypothetical protein